MTWAWISAAPSKIDRMRASHRMREIGNSMAKPLPPWICTALSALDQAMRDAARDMRAVVGVGPGDASGKQLRHPGFEIAAPSGILLTRGIISELPRD